MNQSTTAQVGKVMGDDPEKRDSGPRRATDYFIIIYGGPTSGIVGAQRVQHGSGRACSTPWNLIPDPIGQSTT